jgi:hypothetical protein
MVHLERSTECYGWYRKFITYPTMIIHLESGTCNSEINLFNLNESSAMCFQWKAYIDEDYRDELLHREDVQSKYTAAYPFRCPKCRIVLTSCQAYSNTCIARHAIRICTETEWPSQSSG